MEKKEVLNKTVPQEQPKTKQALQKNTEIKKIDKLIFLESETKKKMKKKKKTLK